MQFVYVIRHGQHQDLRGYLPVPTQQKLPVSVILLDHTKGAFGLDGAVHTQEYTCFAGDPFKRVRPLRKESLGNMNLTVAL